MDIEIRAIDPGEFDAFFQVLSRAMGFDAPPADVESFRGLLALDRTIGCFDGPDIVGALGTFPFELTVPGGARVPMGGTTTVAVLPTHRRRGLLRRMMAWHLDDARAHGEPLLGLYASEGSIYRRWGFGLAARSALLELRADRARFVEPPPAGYRVAFVEPTAALPDLQQVWEAALPERPGMLSRSDDWWEKRTLRPSRFSKPKGATALRWVVCRGPDGAPCGYAAYHQISDWRDGLSRCALVVREIIAADPAAERALWHYLLGVDLIETLRVMMGREDSILPLLLDNPRAVVARPWDTLWLSVLDVPVALEARRYSADGQIVLGVGDERWELDVTEGVGRCKRASRDADVELPAWGLGAAYLGGERVERLARAGVAQGEWRHVQRLGRMLAWEPRAWCPFRF